MSEVKRFDFDIDEAGANIRFVELADGGYTLFTDFDAQRLRADTAEAELAKMTADRDNLKGIASAYIASDGAKDLRIAAAEQRISDVVELLRGAWKYANHDLNVVTVNRELAARIIAALNQKSEGESHADL